MNLGLAIVLIGFALIGYAGTGASLAVARFRQLNDGQADPGMLGVAGMLLLFGGLCTSVAVGWLGIIAIGSIVTWMSYISMARHIGLFSVEVNPAPERVPVANSSGRF